MSAGWGHDKPLSGMEPHRGFSGLRSPNAPSVLGAEHPVSRSAVLIHTLVVQATATSSTVLVGVLAVAERRSWGVRLLAVAVLVEFALLAILMLARQIQREHILRLIAGGGQRVRLEEVARQVGRLADPRYRLQLARRLERALEDAEGWHRIPIASRPPRGIKVLAEFAPDAQTMIERLRVGHTAVPGLALLDLVLGGSYESTLYIGDRAALGEQLGRINYLLGSGTVGNERATRGREERSWCSR